MKKHIVFILLAGMLWGFMGYFVRTLEGIGVSSTGAILLRCGLAAVLFGITILVQDSRMFRVKLRDIWCFIGSGLCSMLFFTYCYFRSMDYIDLSTAAILLYTAPSIVIILSRFIFKERFTPLKVLAVVLAFTGCCLVSGIGSGERFSAVGVLLGLGSGFGYALYSIFARLAMDRGYNSLTVNFYTCLLAAAGAWVIWGTQAVPVMCSSAGNALLCVAAAVITCYLPYLLYTRGLSGVEAGRASIMASVEPVVATLTGVFIFHEELTPTGFCGIVLVLGAIVLLNTSPEKFKLKHNAKRE
jgi:drug/metabolite transporter (DMT)-like permease